MGTATLNTRADTWGAETIAALDWLKEHNGGIYWRNGASVEISYVSSTGSVVLFTAPGVVVGVRAAKILQDHTNISKVEIDAAITKAFHEVIKETLWVANVNAANTSPDTTMPEQKSTVPNLLMRMRETHDTKNKDYAGGKGDPYANFRMCEKFGIPAHMGVLVRMSDKFMRIGNLAERQLKSGEGAAVKDESIYDTLLDLAVYSLLMYCLYEEWSTAQ